MLAYGVGAVGAETAATTTTDRSPSVTTTQPDSGVLHVLVRRSGALGNPVTMAGADMVLSNTNTGGEHTSFDLTVCLGWSQAPTPRSYGATASWPTGAAAAARSIELLSEAP